MRGRGVRPIFPEMPLHSQIVRPTFLRQAAPSGEATVMAKNIVVLTGAGISRESGLHTFRDSDGIWKKVRIEDVATPEAFARDPERVNAFYNGRRRQLLDPAVQPNAAHRALVALERSWKGDFLLITQNVDDLHQRAGSRRVLPMHGQLLQGRCAYCGAVFPAMADIDPRQPCPMCHACGGLRPDVVWFGEMPYGLDEAFDALRKCDLFVAIGTSGAIYPAAQFVAEARRGGAHTIQFNLEPADNSDVFAECRLGPATQTVPAWVEEVLRSSDDAELNRTNEQS